VTSAVRRWCGAIGWYVGSVMGDRDYRHYVEHLRRCHPDAAIPSERDFWRQRYAEMDADPGSRCC
jgi:uncharacterized short protein YbdD (DUF466 family)